MNANIYNLFMKQYKLNHKCCPKCGSDKCVETLMAFIINMESLNDYKDLNNSECVDCGHKCKVHDRISAIQAAKI